MNKYQEALYNLRLLERIYVFKTTRDVVPQVWCDTLQELVKKATPKNPTKTAKEMFEELGYEQTINNEYGIEYNLGREGEVGREWKSVTFVLDNKVLHAFENYVAMRFDVPTFKAIHQQMKELGWLDE